MSADLRTDIPSVSVFKDALNEYEVSLDLTNPDPEILKNSASKLHGAVSRILASSLPDTMQMLRHLTDRMYYCETDAYSEATILRMASGSLDNLIADEIMMSVYYLFKIMRGDEVDLSNEWLSHVRNNAAIGSFFSRFKTSDQYQLKQCDPTCIFESSETIVEYQSDVPLYYIDIDQDRSEITLNSNVKQAVCFKSGSWIDSLKTANPNKTLVIKSRVSIRPTIGKFKVDRRIIFSQTVKDMMIHMRCIDTTGSIDNSIGIILPNPFYVCKFDIVSFDSGTTWLVGNILILPPSLRN